MEGSQTNALRQGVRGYDARLPETDEQLTKKTRCGEPHHKEQTERARVGGMLQQAVGYLQEDTCSGITRRVSRFDTTGLEAPGFEPGMEVCRFRWVV